MPNQSDTYTTEAIACGLSDVAGWLPMKDAPTGVPIIAKHKPNPRMPHGWVATIKLGHGDEEEADARDTILHYNGDDLFWNFHGCWTGWLPVGSSLPAAPSHSGEADRVGLGELAARFEAKRIEAAGFADEQADNSSGWPGQLERECRTLARTWAEARDMALAADEDALIARSWGRLSAVALAGEARSAETHSGSVHEHAAPQGATPSPLPHPQAPNTLSELEEARAQLLAIDGVLEAAQQEADRLRDETDGYGFPNWLAQENHEKADRIEAALATLRASQEQDGEVRS